MKKADHANLFSGDKRDGLNWYIKASYFWILGNKLCEQNENENVLIFIQGD